MSESHAETRKDAEHILSQFPDGHGAVVNVARAYLDLLTEQDALREVVKAAKKLADNCDPDDEDRGRRGRHIPYFLALDAALAALPTPKQQEEWTEYQEFRKRTDPPPWGLGEIEVHHWPKQQEDERER